MTHTSSARWMPLASLDSPHQKCTAAIRMLAYGIPGDLVDEYVRVSESNFEQFVQFHRELRDWHTHLDL